MTPPKSPLVAGLLSVLLPGAGQLYNGERAKGWSLVCMAAGLWITALASRSLVTWALLSLVYAAVLLPAVLDAQRTARGQTPAFTGDSTWYVIVMLLALGPFALPLLWQSRRFSRTGKILWTATVIIIALSVALLMAAIGPLLEQLVPSLPPSS